MCLSAPRMGSVDYLPDTARRDGRIDTGTVQDQQQFARTTAAAVVVVVVVAAAAAGVDLPGRGTNQRR